jgi:hypothetical protein
MNYKKVIADYNNGTIDRTKWVLRIDNDGGYWEYIGEDVKFDSREYNKLIKGMEKKYGFPGGYKDTVAILQAAGVEADWV